MSAEAPGAGATPSDHRRLWRLAAPVILSGLTVPLQTAVDAAVVGHLGDAANLGGVALGGTIFVFLYWGLFCLRQGTTGLTAQAEGARNFGAAKLILARGLLVAIALGVLFVALGRPILWLGLEILGGSPEVQSAAGLYFLARLFAAPASLANFVILGWLLGRQRTRRSFLVQATVNLSNAGLAVLFVFGFRWGVVGVGAATAIADYLGFVLGLALAWPLLERGPLRRKELLDRAALRRFFRVNRDLFLRTAALIATLAYFTRTGARLGAIPLAANALLLNFHTFTSYGLDGLALATESIVGAAVGRGDRAAFRRAVRAGLVSALLVALAFSALFLLLGPAILRALTDIEPVREAALRLLPWAVATPLVSVWSFQFDGVFIGAIATRALRNTMVFALLVFFASAPILVPRFGNDGLWAAFMLFMAARGAAQAVVLPRIERGLAAGVG
ncbi:MAG TPA: MATE family efflux transporter [Stellaceae bacterium]|nr:MATE family efflux transporter [Stellaceae bacterium]